MMNDNKIKTAHGQAKVGELAKLEFSLEETQKDLASLKQEAREVKARLRTQIEQHAVERGQLNERITMLQAARLELKEEAGAQLGKLDAAMIRLNEKGEELTRLALENAQLMQVLSEKGRELTGAEQQNVQLMQALAEKGQELTGAAQQNAQLTQALAEKGQALHEAKIEADRLAEMLAAQQQAFAAQEQVLASTREQAKTLNEQKQALEHDLRVHKEDSAAKLEILSDELEERFHELATLTRLLMARDSTLKVKNQEIETERHRVARLKATVSWQVTAPLRAIGRLFGKRRGSLGAKIRLIEQSGLFEKRWYLDQYPDVAEIKMDPVRHYLLHGAAENRNPGSGFDTSWYLSEYADVAESGINPLLHYIKMGKREGRRPKA